VKVFDVINDDGERGKLIVLSYCYFVNWESGKVEEIKNISSYTKLKIIENNKNYDQRSNKIRQES
jgi:hypothetical protein